MKQLLYMRDRAFILIMAHSGDRAGDLGQVSAKQIFWLQDKQGLLFFLTMGKTLQGKSTRKFVVLRSTDVNICPVQALIEFRDGLLKLGFCKARYLFSAVNPSMSAFLDKPLSSAVVCNRLKDHLSSIGLWEGETSHGARSACAILLQTLSVSNEGIKRHVGWNTDAMLKEYTSVSVRTKGYSTDLLDPTQVESKNTIVKSNGLFRVLMLNLWIFSLEKNKSENSGLNNLTIYYKLIKRQSNGNTIKYILVQSNI